MSDSINIYALLVGINNYPNPRHRLEGCVRDVESLQTYLKTFSQDYQLKLEIATLTDSEATREGIIQGFQHFKKAQKNDICLFHYSGHGARLPVPKEFRHLESDGYLESIVCYDSRKENGFDLVDKELAWLIWQITNQKEGVHFLTIMDCCHSGRITRNSVEIEENILPREVNINSNKRAVKDYLGFTDYTKVGEHQYTPRQGRHVLLAASRDNQTAKEVFVKNERRGIFTYCLLDALKKAQGQLSYNTLINRVNLRIRNIVKAQSPQVLSTVPADKKRYFLIGKNSDLEKRCLASWDKLKGEWQVNMGIMHGLTNETNATTPTLFKLLKTNSKTEISAKEIFLNYSVIIGLEDCDKAKIYPVQIISQPTSPFLVGITDDSEKQGIDLIYEQLNIRSSNHFQLTSNNDAQYFIHAKNNAWSLYLANNLKNKGFLHPLFPKVKNYSKSNSINFSNDLEMAFKWIKLLELKHPDTRIREEEIDIQLHKVTATNHFKDDSPSEILNWQQPKNFAYTHEKGTWKEPSFRLKIGNKSHRALWFSVCYFGADFSIQNSLLTIQELQPNEEVWAFIVDEDGHKLRTIPLWLADDLLEGGKAQTSIEEYLKIFICTEEFSTDDFNQEGIPSNRPTRGFGRRSTIQRPDWATCEILLKIERPELIKI